MLPESHAPHILLKPRTDVAVAVWPHSLRVGFREPWPRPQRRVQMPFDEDQHLEFERLMGACRNQLVLTAEEESHLSQCGTCLGDFVDLVGEFECDSFWDSVH